MESAGAEGGAVPHRERGLLPAGEGVAEERRQSIFDGRRATCRRGRQSAARPGVVGVDDDAAAAEDGAIVAVVVRRAILVVVDPSRAGVFVAAVGLVPDPDAELV